MRWLITLGAIVAMSGVNTPSAQDDLSRLVPQDPQLVDLHFENAPVQVVLDELAALGDFEVYFSRDIDELLPVDLRVERADYETVLRRVLNAADLSYRVVGEDTLLVSRSLRVLRRHNRRDPVLLRLPAQLTGRSRPQ